jgi:sorbitol-specific phosphotransferase system component IIC
MDVAIQVVWWIGLIGALIPTLIILKEVALVLRTITDIYRLARITRDAARGVATNVSVIPSLAALTDPLAQLRSGTGALVVAAATIERKLGG